MLHRNDDMVRWHTLWMIPHISSLQMYHIAAVQQIHYLSLKSILGFQQYRLCSSLTLMGGISIKYELKYIFRHFYVLHLVFIKTTGKSWFDSNFVNTSWKTE